MLFWSIGFIRCFWDFHCSLLMLPEGEGTSPNGPPDAPRWGNKELFLDQILLLSGCPVPEPLSAWSLLWEKWFSGLQNTEASWASCLFLQEPSAKISWSPHISRLGREISDPAGMESTLWARPFVVAGLSPLSEICLATWCPKVGKRSLRSSKEGKCFPWLLKKDPIGVLLLVPLLL